MPSWTIALLFGIALPAGFPALPPVLPIVAAAGVALALHWRWRHAATAWLLAATLGLCWGTGYGYRLLAGLIPPSEEGATLYLTGRIVGLVEATQAYGKPLQRFRFAVGECTGAEGKPCAVTPRLVQLRWAEAPSPSSDELWRLPVRLKRPHGLANPGGFDYESWLVAQGVGATGSVRDDEAAQRLGTARAWHPRTWRQQARSFLHARLASLPSRPLLLALLVGDGGALEQEHWRLLRETGTVHLFVVSGLHIALSGGIVLSLAGVWLKLPWSRGGRRHQLAAWAPALLVAGLYALLAGFGLPIRRALIMFAVAGLAAVGWRQRRTRDAWLLALLIVVALDPLAVVQSGFWFSFLAVAAILTAVVGHRDARNGELSPAASADVVALPPAIDTLSRAGRNWWRVQWATFAVTAPLLLGMIGSVPWIGLLANAIAIPLVTLLVLPLALLAWVLEPLVNADLLWPLWQGADALLRLLLTLLGWLQQQAAPWQWRPAGMGAVALVCAGASALLWLLPRPFPGRALAALLLLPALWPAVERPAPGTAWIHVLDVGQGLSVLVQSHRHDLLYDTGPVWGSGLTVAEVAVMPALQRLGVIGLDRLVVSHDDSDHAGGWRALAAGLPIATFWSGEPVGAAHETACEAGQRWEWDGVRFGVLHPRWRASRGNDNSCVLWIGTGESSGGSALLPGDIGVGIERQLAWDGALRPAGLLVAPHHGSAGSSSAALIAALQPRHVVFAAGYRNAFGHPAMSVQEAYEAAGARLYTTAASGMLTFELSPAGVQALPSWRERQRRYWHRRPP